MNERRSRSFRNDLITLPNYYRLVEVVCAMTEPSRTADLRGSAGLNREKDGVTAALWTFELSGLIHGQRKSRNELIWYPGPRAEPVPDKLRKHIEPFATLRRALEEHGTTPISTERLIRQAGLGRPRALGALKALTALGHVAYRSEPLSGQRNWVVRWWWASAARGWDFELDAAHASLDQAIGGGDERTLGDLLAAGRIPRRTRRGTLRFDAVDSSDGLPF